MPSPSFDNIFNKFKTSTKQAADQMGRAAKVAKLKMEIMTLTGERSRHLQTIGTKAYDLFTETSGLPGDNLLERVRSEIVQIERIDVKSKEIENQILDLQALIQSVEVQDVTDEEPVADTADSAK